MYETDWAITLNVKYLSLSADLPFFATKNTDLPKVNCR